MSSRGIWIGLLCMIVAACSPRADAPGFHGSTRSLIYHKPSCEWAQKIYAQNRIVFATQADARAKGYRACKVCKP